MPKNFKTLLRLCLKWYSLALVCIAPTAHGEPPNSWRNLAVSIDGYHQFLDKILARKLAQSPPYISREQLKKSLGYPVFCSEDSSFLINSTLLAETERYNLFDTKAEIPCYEGITIPLSGLLAIPKNNSTKGLLLAIHGTGSSPEQIFQLEDQSHYDVKDYHHSFAHRAANLGFAVFAPRVITNPTYTTTSSVNRDRNKIDRRAEAMGMKLLGIELFALTRFVNGLQQVPSLTGKKVGVYGISLGGALAFYLAALNENIDAAVVSQWIEERSAKLASRNHPTAYWQYSDYDYLIFHDGTSGLKEESVIRLISPRPLFLESGSNDNRSQTAVPVFEAAKRMYPIHAISNGALCFSIEAGGHEIFFDKPMQFFSKWLDKDDNSRLKSPPTQWCSEG